MTPRRSTMIGAVVLVGLSAGFFFTYAASVTLGLAEVDDVTYVDTFRAINDTVSNPWFGAVFFGSIPATATALALNWRYANGMTRGLMTSALVLYLVGLVITGTGNVPLNENLAEVGEVTAVSAEAARADFENDWNRLNLTRTIAFGASFVALAAAAITPHAQNTRQAKDLGP